MLAEYAPDPDGPPDPIDPTAPDGLLKARQYLYGPALLAAESFDPSPEPPAPSLVFYHLDPLGSTVNLTAGANVPGDGKEYLASGTAVLSGSVATASTAGVLADPIPGAVTAAYLYDAWGNYRELDLSNPAAPDKLADPDDPADPDPAGWFASPDLGPDGLYAWESYLASIQSAYDRTNPEPPASSLAVWNRLTYTGHELDPETGLYYFKARFYDPELGRFASADPYLGDTLTPPSLHRYLYANSSPLTYRDLTGCISVKDATVEFLTGLGEVVAEPVNLAVDMVIMGGVAIHQTTADYPMYAEHLRFHSMTARAQQARLAAGTSRLTIGLEGLYSLEANLATLGLGGISEAMIGQYRAYRAGWIGYDEFNRRMSRLSGNIVGGAAFLKITESSANSGRGGGSGRVHQRVDGRAVDDQVWVEDATIVPRAKGTFPTEEASSTSRYASAQAETIIEKSALRDPGGGAQTTAAPSPRCETTGSVAAKTPVEEVHAPNSGPGQWVPKARRSGPSLEHQSKMSGQPIQEIGGKNVVNEYEVQGVLFDDFKSGKLIDYKDNYSKLINKQGEFYDWFKGRTELRDQALRQVRAANDLPVVWKVGENQVQAFKTAVGDVPGLTIVP